MKKGKDRTGKYDQNEVEQPWENLEPTNPADGDYKVGGNATKTSSEDVPDWV